MNTSSTRRFGAAPMIVAAVALFVALSGTAIAAKDLITGKQIAKNTVTSKNVKNGTLKTGDLNKKTVASLQGKQGPKGDKGDPGANGIVNPTSGFDIQENIPANQVRNVVTLNVPAGQYVVTAKVNLFSVGTDAFGCNIEANDVEVEASPMTWEPAANNLDLPAATQGVTPAGTTKIELACGSAGDTTSTRDASLIAIPVG